MTPTTLTCPRCRGACFAATLEDGTSVVNPKYDDSNVYITLTCQKCAAPGSQLQFVVDLTPEKF